MKHVNNKNYQLELDNILKEIEHSHVPSLLIHACCAPCSSYVIEYLSNYFHITIYYYNPNIFPEGEYVKRINELKKFLMDFPTVNKVEFIEGEYIPDIYYEGIKGLEELGERSERCYACYKLRMDKAAAFAADTNFDFFTTTLTISPYKVSDWVNEIGASLQEKYGIRYLYADFKKNNGYIRSLELSKLYKLYRQDYCGCEFSKREQEKK